jgi:lambda family phage portal protein
MTVGGAFDGASRFDKALALWQPSLASADLDILPDKPFVDARVRDSLRNDAYVAAGAEIHKDNIVGTMFLLNCKPATKVLGLDETWEKEFQEEIETKFTLYAESPSNWLDVTRMGTFTTLIRLVVGIICAANEVLAANEWMDDGRPYRTAVQLIDLDRLSNPFGMFNNPLLRGGVVRTKYGMPTAYHIRKAHPADFTQYANLDPFVWDLIPARKPWGRQNIIHIVEQTRVDQSRGMSAMVAALKELRITKKFRDVVLQNAVVNATYAASIESELPSETVMSQIGGGNIGDAVEQYTSAFLSSLQRYAGNAKNLAIDGVKIPHLFPGTKLQLRPAGQGGPLGTDFEASLLRYIAANLGVSYEQLSKDYSKLNYASYRGAVNETWKGMQGKKKRGADRFATSVYRAWLEEAINIGEITSMSKKAPSIYDSNGMLGQAFDAYSACEWIGASRGQTDELKETQAAIQRLLFGLSTWEDELGRLGKDWRKVFAQLQREQAEQEARGILQNMQSNMMNAVTGASNPNEPGESSTSTGGGSKGGKK